MVTQANIMVHCLYGSVYNVEKANPNEGDWRYQVQYYTQKKFLNEKVTFILFVNFNLLPLNYQHFLLFIPNQVC